MLREKRSRGSWWMDEAKGRRFLIGRRRNGETICRTEEWWRLWFKSRAREKREILLTWTRKKAIGNRMNFGRGLRKGHNYFMDVQNTIVCSEAIAFFCRISSFPGRNVLYIPSYETRDLAIDKNICYRKYLVFSSVFFANWKRKKKEKKKKEEENDFSRILRFDRESLSAYFSFRTAKVEKETNIRVRCSWDSFLFCPSASPRVLSKKQRDRN